MSVYLDAITVLEERGWYQGDFKGPNGEVCAMQAVFVAVLDEAILSRDGWDAQYESDMYRVLEDELGGTPIGKFNDDPHTTYEDVVLFLKRAHEASGAAS